MKGLSAKMVLPLMALIAVVGMAGIYMAATSGQQTVTDGDGNTIVNSPNEVKDASLTLNAIDTAGDSSTSVTDVQTTVWKASSSDAYGTRLKTGATMGDLSITSGLSTADSYTVVETDSSYYTTDTGRADGETVDQPFESISIDSTQPVGEFHVKSVASDSDMSISLYDDRNNELTTGDTDQEDYEVTMSADDAQDITAEMEQSTDGVVYHVAGMAYKPLNAVDGVTVNSITGPDGESVSFSTATVPEHLQTEIYMDASNNSDAVSDYQTLLEFDEPVELAKNEELIVDFTVESDQSTDPSAVDSGDLTDTDALLVQFKDADHYTTPDLSAGYGIADESTSESDVGLDESDSVPYGAQTGFVIEAK